MSRNSSAIPTKNISLFLIEESGLKHSVITIFLFPLSISLFLIEESGLKRLHSNVLHATRWDFSLLNWREWIETFLNLHQIRLVNISLFLIEESGLKPDCRMSRPIIYSISLFLIEESGLKQKYKPWLLSKTLNYFSLLNWREWIETASASRFFTSQAIFLSS